MKDNSRYCPKCDSQNLATIKVKGFGGLTFTPKNNTRCESCKYEYNVESK